MVYILGFNGSPRKYGNTFKLLKAALLGSEKEGAETELIHLYDREIKPCIGCLSDEESLCGYPCVIEDDMREIYDKILKADGLIIATPIYWFDVSGVVKNLIDRLTALENMIHHSGYSWLEGKYGGIIAVGNDEGGVHVISTLLSTLVSMGVGIPPWALAYYSGKEDVIENERVMMDAVNVGRVLALAASNKNVKRWYVEDKTLLNEIKDRVLKETESNIRIQKNLRMKTIKSLKINQKAWQAP